MAATRILKVGTAVARPGQWTRGELVLGHYPDAPITAPVNILTGTKDGPTLWVQAAIHGPEIGGAIGVLRLFERLDPAKMTGTIVAVMAANPTAFRGAARNTPLDGENLNRCFPGDARGPHSRQTASVLLETALATADAMMDLHSGADALIVPFYALHWDDGSPAAQESARLARAIGSPDIWSSKDAWISGSMFTAFTRKGKPAIIVECGGTVLSDAHIDNFTGAIRGVAQAMGILAGKPPAQRRYRVWGEAFVVYNRKGGYFAPAVEAGATVRKGQKLGAVMDPHGRVIEEPVSPVGPAYVAGIARPYLPVYSGAMIAECVKSARGGR
ncbi:MAG: hypothetical protein ACT4P2_07310 [Pseudomonadota bacterium]